MFAIVSRVEATSVFLDINMKNVLIITLLLTFILFSVSGFAQDYMKWGLPENAILRLGKGSIRDLKHSPNGDLIAVATSIGVWIYDADSGKEIRLLRKHIYPVNSLAFSPNGKLLASGSDDIHLWEPHTGQHLFTLKESAVDNLVFSPDGHTLASTSDKMIRLWDISNRTISKTLTGHAREIRSLTVSPDGKTIVSGSYGFNEQENSYKLRWWDVETGRTNVFLTNMDSTSVDALAFSPNGKILAYAGMYPSKIYLINSSNGELLETLHGHGGKTYTLTFSPDGKMLASSGFDNTIHLWEPHTGHHIHTLYISEGTLVSFSPDGETLVSGSGDGTIRFWDPSTKQQRLSISGHWQEVHALAFSADSKTLISGIRDAIIHKWDIETGQLTSTLVGRYGEDILAFDIGRNMFATYSFSRKKDNNKDNIYIRSIDTGNKHSTVNAENFTPFLLDRATFSHDGTLISTRDGEKVKYGFPVTFEFTPFRRGDAFTALAASPDNKLLAVSRRVGVSVWKFGTNELIRLYPEVDAFGDTIWCHALAFSSDSKTLTIGNWSDIRLIEVDTGNLITTLSGNNSNISALAFSPNGKMLASGSKEGAILIWDLDKIMKNR